MAKVKVFAPTYKRNNTFVRSIESLLKQTLADWICEVHNDAPQNTFPENYINSLNDTRFTVINHTTNLGPVATFNMMFDVTECRYICLLEDDNWWENDFLEVMSTEMDNHQECAVGFSNIFLWQEKEDNIWEKLPAPLWPVEDEKYKLIRFPQHRHVFNYHHSSCSIIIRNSAAIENYKVPENIRFDFIEPIRERAYPHPLLFIGKPLANFAITINTSRTNGIIGLYEHYMLLTDSFFNYIDINDEYAKQLWDEARQSKLHSYLKLIYTGLICKSSRKLLAYANAKEWLFFILYNIKHPSIFSRCVSAKKTYAELWGHLLINTQKRVKEAKKTN